MTNIFASVHIYWTWRNRAFTRSSNIARYVAVAFLCRIIGAGKYSTTNTHKKEAFDSAPSIGGPTKPPPLNEFTNRFFDP